MPMTSPKRPTQHYMGFEQGPIRPPSEAFSLLIRVTRNCPWNHCSFCPVYKGTRFSIRPVDHVKRDIDLIFQYIDILKSSTGPDGTIRPDQVRGALQGVNQGSQQALQAAAHWFSTGMESMFIQDANSLIIKPDHLVDILNHFKSRFPGVKRITSYARSHTIARIRDDDLKRIAGAGLNRIHIGLESGSDAVLKTVKKGVTKADHIKAGCKVKAAGMELSEYVMPGLGGQALTREHAVETADALNQINPDFIRLRTLAIPNGLPLFDDWETGRFEKLTDLAVAKEIRLFIENLNGISSVLASDHILNLFEEIRGRFPEDKPAMLGTLDQFLSMPAESRCTYQVGRRLGLFSRLSDMADTTRLHQAEHARREFGVTPDNVDDMIDELMKRYI